MTKPTEGAHNPTQAGSTPPTKPTLQVPPQQQLNRQEPIQHPMSSKPAVSSEIFSLTHESPFCLRATPL